jgi:spore germination protein YaaH
LYTWNGKAWQWLPSQIIPVKNVIRAEVNFLPESVVIMQTRAIKPGLAADYNPNPVVVPDDIEKTLTEINPQGLAVSSNGQIVDELDKIPVGIQNTDLKIIPTLRNWAGANTAGSNPVEQLLIDSKAREKHRQAIVALVQDKGYQGIDLDYRGLNPDLRSEYTAFLLELRQALPDDKLLSVRVDLPQQLSTGNWDTGAYDWPAIGRIADEVKIPAWPDPKTYATGAKMEAMLNWAVGRINRYKLQLLVRTNSAEQVDHLTRELSRQQALELLRDVTVIDAPESANPGQELDFSLAGLAASTGLQVDKTSGAYWFAYLDKVNRHHTIYLENVANITELTRFVEQYRLNGLAMQSLPGHNHNDQTWEAVRAIADQTAQPDKNEYAVEWRVLGQDGRLIAQASVDLESPNYSWTAPAAGGIYEVEANISSNSNETVVPQASVVFEIATPTPSPTPTSTPTPKPTATPTAAPTATPKPAPADETPANTAPPPAVAPANVPFGYGIQVDPRGDTAANIEHIEALGFNWVKFQMAWKDVEPAQGDYSWGMWDNLINAYHDNGIQILLSIPKAPDWARPFDDDKSVEGPPQDPGLYARFAGLVADRYRAKVQAVEVWNEQNLWYEAGGVGRINAANYVQLLQLSYRTIKGTNPDMIVVSGALTPAGTVGGAAVDDVEYLNQMYANGVKGFFDALGAHPSGYNCPANGDWRTVQDPTATSFRGPFENRHHSWCFRGTMEAYREVMVANGDGNKAIIPTEFGWAVSGNPQPGYEYARDNTLEEQAQWIGEAYQMGKNWGWVGPMFLWNLDYGVTAPGTELANFSILNRPAFGVLANLPK